MVKVVVIKADTYDEQVVELAMKELFPNLNATIKLSHPENILSIIG